MSTPQATRGQRGGNSARGGRGTSNSTSRGRGNRGISSARGRGRGVSKAGADGNSRAASPSGGGLLQQLRDGTARRGAGNRQTTPARGRGDTTSSPFVPGLRGRGARNLQSSSTLATSGRSRGPANNSKPLNDAAPQKSAPRPHRDFMNAKYEEFQTLKQSREKERAKAIRDGFLADPEKKTSLDKAITVVGTCTELCPRFERVERINQNLIDRAEKEHDEETGKDFPAEDRMVKRFRRSAAGDDEQLPSDIRTPETLKRTLNYLCDEIIGGEERLATVQKFVWDRTRAIRNDFSIQQVTNVADVELAVECYERIARFHILSLHQLSNPNNLQPGEHFDVFQEKEQLNNSIVSLMYYYDDHRDRVSFPNEAEFRAYLVIFEFAAMKPDTEDRMQSWPRHILEDDRVKTALKLYRAAGDTMEPRGPLQPYVSAAIAQATAGSFWSVLASKSVPYIMACFTELYFQDIRFASLDALWRSCKQQPQSQQAKSRDWSLNDLTDFLGFDSDYQTKEFCEAFDLSFITDENGEEYLNLVANTAKSLDKSSTPRQQVFSKKYVEKKRYHRSLPAVINGLSVADAIRSGATESHEEEQEQEDYDPDDDENMFVAEDNLVVAPANTLGFGSSLDPAASPFTPSFGQTTTSSSFGKSSGSGVFGSTSLPGTALSAQPQQALSSFGKATRSGGFGSSIARPFGADSPAIVSKPVDLGGFVVATTTGKSTAEQKSSAASSNGFGKSLLQPKQPSSVPPSYQPLSPLFSKDFQGPTTFTPSAPSSGALFKPATTAQEKTTNSFSLFPAPTQTPSEPNPAKEESPPSPAFTPPAWLTPKSQSAKPTLTSASPPPFNPLSPPAAQPVLPPTPVPTDLSNPLVGSRDTLKPSIEQTQSPAPAEPTTIPSVPTSEKPTFAPTLIPTSLQPQPQPQPERITTPPFSPRQSPVKPVPPPADRKKLAATVARIGFIQPNGLISSFLDVALREFLVLPFHQHQQELREAAIASIRDRILARKFGYLWRQRAWSHSLNRRAKQRRQMFAQTIRAEQARKQRSEQELEEILRAAQESKRLQKEIEEAVKTPKNTPIVTHGAEMVKVAGQKRKSFSGQALNASTMASSIGPTSSTPSHKRSKTMTSSDLAVSMTNQASSVPAFRASTSRPQHVSIFSRTSAMGRSTGNSDLRTSQSAQRLDTTRTDYFRLKAMGVDPDTPIIPDTKESLAIRRKKEEEERQASIAKASRRIRGSALYHSSPTSLPSLPQNETPEPQPIQSAASTPSPVEDDFLKQIREAREAMAEQTAWFKDQSVNLEREIEQEDEFRRSQSSRDYAGSPRSSSGLAKSNGYEYLPADTKPGSSLSRTELRIRQTGAHGLATKPIWSRSDYVPVAMSKKTAFGYSNAASSSPARKRSHNDVEPSGETENAHKAALHALKRPRAIAKQPERGPYQRPKQGSRNGAQNSFQALQSVDLDDEYIDDEHDTEELLDDDDQDRDDEPSNRVPYSTYYQTNGGYADDEEGEEEEDALDEDGDDDGDEYEVEHGPAGQGYESEEEELAEEDEEAEGYEYPAPYFHASEYADDDDAATPATNPQVSRAASSALGGSVDDAFVIDDSD